MLFKTVPEDFYGRLDRFLRRYFPHIPQSILEKGLRKGEVRLNKAKSKSNARVVPGDIVSYPPSFDVFLAVDHTRIKDPFLYEKFRSYIVYENEEFCVINKPAGIASQGGSNVICDIDRMANSGHVTHFLVHRLDKGTSGLLLLAKNSITANVFMHQFRERKIQKYYLAYVERKPAQDSGIIDLPLYSAGESVCVNYQNGKSAITRYRVVGKVGEMVCLLLKPYTGRKHQIRVHLKEGLGLPIIGDEKYGAPPGKRLFLHAYQIKIPYGRGKTLTINSRYQESI